jgi:hypothetical protein
VPWYGIRADPRSDEPRGDQGTGQGLSRARPAVGSATLNT